MASLGIHSCNWKSLANPMSLPPPIFGGPPVHYVDPYSNKIAQFRVGCEWGDKQYCEASGAAGP